MRAAIRGEGSFQLFWKHRPSITIPIKNTNLLRTPNAGNMLGGSKVSSCSVDIAWSVIILRLKKRRTEYATLINFNGYRIIFRSFHTETTHPSFFSLPSSLGTFT
jgi:hypothetical protein